MDPGRFSLVDPQPQDKSGAQFIKREGDAAGNEAPSLYNSPVSPPSERDNFADSFGASITRKHSDSNPDARSNTYDALISPGDDSHGVRISSYSHQVPPDTPYDPPYDTDTPYDHPYDPKAQTAMNQMEEPQSANFRSPMSFMSPNPAMASGKDDYRYTNQLRHDSDTRTLLNSAKIYDHRDSRMFLLRTGSYRFSITLFFCLLIGLSLKAYEGFGSPRVIDKEGVRVFNAIMIGLSLGLGLNLASSLKRYGVILRWSLLTKRYVSLEVFDLILGLETLTNVGKLMVISLPGIKKVGFLRNWPWFRDARDDGTRWTWLVCLIWILVNIGAQVLVAALSLFWPVDPSNTVPILTWGSVSVSDLSLWNQDPPGLNWNATALQAAWSYGNEATSYPVFPLNESHTDLSSLAGTPMYKGDGFYEYRFLNRNPDYLYTNYMVSGRKVQARATCKQLETKGQYVETDDSLYILAKTNDGEFHPYYLPEVADGSLTWTASNWEFCGPRCTNFTVYQGSDGKEITRPSLFLCENRLSAIEGGEKDFDNLKTEDKEPIYSNDEFARIATGALAWTGWESYYWPNYQVRSYLRGSKWSPYPTISKAQVEDLLARYTMGAIAAFDDHGVRYLVQRQRTMPTQGQQLSVDWPYVLSLLGAICLIQLAALVALLGFANKSIIRDESFFSVAMLLNPVMNRIGREGMNLSGAELKMHPKLRWKKIRYDYREGEEGEPNQVDIFIQGKDRVDSRRSWASGVYA